MEELWGSNMPENQWGGLNILTGLMLDFQFCFVCHVVYRAQRQKLSFNKIK